MCGVIGTIGLEISDATLDTLVHRGPDSNGCERISAGNKIVSLAHTRLSILDLSPAGHQPMRSSDERWVIIFNGEIYNHIELRRSTTAQYRGHSDTETLVELIAAKGIERAVGMLNGMFAFAALDTQQGKLYLVRDPLGIKPLYFHKGESGQFAFASELRTLRQLKLTSGIDSAALRQFLTLRYTPSPSTLWKDIQRLPPGHILTLDVELGSHALQCYIQPVTERFSGSQNDAIEAYREALFAAVKRQLLSDVPVGLLLSGGIDSALIAAAAKEQGVDLPCYTVGFGKFHPECEIEDARETARILGLPFHSVEITPDDLQTALPAIARAVEEPLGTTSIMAMWYLVKRARDDVTVVLTGQGSDEPWGGYFRYQVELLRDRFPHPDFWKKVGNLGSLWRGMPESLDRGLRSLAAHDQVQQIIQACSLFSEHERKLLIGDEWDGGASVQIKSWIEWLDASRCNSGAERMMRLDARMNLADDLLLYGDKISMAVSLEARVPMLDLELVRFVESLPIEYRIKIHKGKIVHKKMAERYLPSEIVYRPKKGFQVPFGEWSRGKWRKWVEELLMSGLDGIIYRPGIEKLWQEHLHMRPDRSRQIFALLMLALWRVEQNFLF